VLWLYTLIPEEDTASFGQEQKKSGIFVVPGFRAVCTNPNSFLEPKYHDYDDGTKGREISMYFLDLERPERFFGYLDDGIDDRDHWFVRNDDVLSVWEA